MLHLQGYPANKFKFSLKAKTRVTEKCIQMLYSAHLISIINLFGRLADYYMVR